LLCPRWPAGLLAAFPNNPRPRGVRGNTNPGAALNTPSMNAASTTAPPASVHPDAPPDDLPALLKAAGKGDDRAWRRLIDLYARRIYALARSRLGAGRHELAEEITQSVFATVATKLGNDHEEAEGGGGGAYAEQGKFESWLFRIAMNRIRDEVRR